jgi:hypothetical protein
MEPCKCIIGNRGSGKSVGLMVDLLCLAVLRRAAVLVLDRPGSLARQMVGHLCAHGIEHRLIYEKAARTDRVLRWRFIKNSRKAGYAGKIENELEDERFVQPFIAKRGRRTLEPNPYTKIYAEAGAAVFRSRGAPELRKLRDPFLFPAIEFHDAVTEATEGKDVFEQLAQRSGRSLLQFVKEAGAAMRLFDIVKSPVLYLRHGDGIDWRDLLLKKYQIYFDLSNVTAEAARALSIFASHAAINACREYYDETGNPLPLVVVLEEAGVMDLVTPFILDSMRELRKAGVSVWIVSQTIEDFDE